ARYQHGAVRQQRGRLVRSCDAHAAGERKGIRSWIENLCARSRRSQGCLKADKAARQEHRAVRQQRSSSFDARTVHIANGGEGSDAIICSRIENLRAGKDGDGRATKGTSTGNEYGSVG